MGGKWADTYNVISAQVILNVPVFGQFQYQINVIGIFEETKQLQNGRMTETPMNVCLLFNTIRHSVHFHQVFVDLHIIYNEKHYIPHNIPSPLTILMAT